MSDRQFVTRRARRLASASVPGTRIPPIRGVATWRDVCSTSYRMKLMLFGVFGVAFLVMNPFYFAGSELDFDAHDLRDAVEGIWVLETPARRYTLHIEQASEPTTRSSTDFVQAVQACGKRTLVKSAHACLHETTMPLVVRTADATGTGTLVVEGSTFARGRLELDVGALHVDARITPDGVAVTGDERVFVRVEP